MRRLSETKGVTGIVCGLLMALAMSCTLSAQSDADSDSIAAADSAGLNELRERQRRLIGGCGGTPGFDAS